MQAVSESILEEGPTIESIISFLRSLVLTNDSRLVRIDEEDDENAESRAQATIAYYKGGRFDPHAEVRIKKHCPAIDTGGVRRQTYHDVFTTIATSSELRLFEGPSHSLRPV